MSVNLKIIPPAAWRPNPIRFGYWLSALGSLVILGAIVGLVLDRAGDGTKYWLLISAAVMMLWFTVFILRLLVWFFQHTHADGWDSRREETLLRETRRGRRVLQILHIGLDVPLPETPFQSPVSLLIKGPSILENQPGRGRENEISFHTFFSLPPAVQLDDEFLEPEIQDIEIFRAGLKNLLDEVATALNPFTSDQSLAVLFESDTTILPRRFIPIWYECLEASGIVQPISYIDGHGMQFIDEWLDNRINDKSLLLVIALQVAPEKREGSTEAMVALLLGNRLTQNTLPPLAWLHRPERTDPQSPGEGIVQAADWAPLEDGQIKHLWLSGLTPEESSAVIPAMALPILSGVPSPSGRHNTDLIIGHAGYVSPWLAAAAAAQTAQQTGTAQLAISADRDNGTLWSQAVTPV
ncbi:MULTISPECIES: hypothetical protein [Tenebrionibacter/Tenebrionicola group]|uniref:Uncharacterized protein n=2 Tax=Tenebrionibacter/Tenebrionicola group TaxID=2969848 RepID=A0A8K0V397_9ENTR|nr:MULTISPECIES: hypothetical protein [Tenebrionibacter/Tenebrionicola group]MBK4716679.1 hypothetical protein [Tenebrionibacter intestinalis]MBV5097373.1 hypothetical protein [Tenebrionicola larvae]